MDSESGVRSSFVQKPRYHADLNKTVSLNCLVLSCSLDFETAGLR